MIPFFTAPNLRFLFNCPLFCLFNDLALSMSSVLFGRCLVHHSLRRQYIIATVCYPLVWLFSSQNPNRDFHETPEVYLL
nr:MAG TPA: hypothetical protein [Caudoviricetes sp.]